MAYIPVILKIVSYILSSHKAEVHKKSSKGEPPSFRLSERYNTEDSVTR